MEWEGQRIIGLGDGEYLETDELVSQDDEVHFDASTHEHALNYCRESAWDECADFQNAWDELTALVTKI